MIIDVRRGERKRQRERERERERERGREIKELLRRRRSTSVTWLR
jgi:hypothetical protein